MAFPLGSGPVAAALCLAGDERRRLDRRHESPAALAAQLDEGTATRIVPVHKRRSKGEQHGCAAETVQVAIGDRWYGCQALEDADPERLHAAIAAMGWPQGRNESYVERLMREPDLLQPAMALSSQRRP